jgi:hypothetical protein
MKKGAKKFLTMAAEALAAIIPVLRGAAVTSPLAGARNSRRHASRSRIALPRRHRRGISQRTDRVLLKVSDPVVELRSPGPQFLNLRGTRNAIGGGGG